MDFYEMDTPGVYHAGTRVSGQSSTAAGLARRYRATLTTAETAVTHPTMVSAISRYQETWHPFANRVVGRIEALGTNTSGSAVTVDLTDEDAGTRVRTTGGDVDAYRTTVNRNINAATPV